MVLLSFWEWAHSRRREDIIKMRLISFVFVANETKWRKFVWFLICEMQFFFCSVYVFRMKITATTEICWSEMESEREFKCLFFSCCVASFTLVWIKTKCRLSWAINRPIKIHHTYIWWHFIFHLFWMRFRILNESKAIIE